MSALSTENLSVSSEDKRPATPLSNTLLKDLPVAKKRSLLLRIIPLVYKCGGTAHLTQVYIDRMASILTLQPIVTFLPGRVLLTWPTSGIGEDELNLLQSPISSVNVALALQCRWGLRLSTLQNLSELVDDMEKNDIISISNVNSRLSEIETEKPKYGSFVLLIAFAMIAAPMAPAFFGGSLLDGLATFGVGFVAGAFALLSDRSSNLLLPLHEMLCAFVCATLTIFLALISSGTSQPISFWPVVLASTIWILPGFSMVIGTIDIASKAGPLPGFIMVFGGMFVALVMGLSYSSAIWIMGINPNTLLRFSTTPELCVDLGVSCILCSLFSIACCMIYQARLSQIPVAVLSTLFCFLSEFVLRTVFLLPDELVHFVVAFSLGIFFRSLSKLAKQIPEPSMYTAMLPLVPGSRIVRASFALLAALHGADCQGANSLFYRSVFGSLAICVIVAFGLLSSELVFERIFMPLFRTKSPFPMTPPSKSYIVQPSTSTDHAATNPATG